MSDSTTSTSLQQGNEWLKPVDPNEGERKWAQYVAATTPPRIHTPMTPGQHKSLPPPSIECLGAGPAPVSIDEGPQPQVSKKTCSPSPNSTCHDVDFGPQLFAQIDGRLVPVTVSSNGAIVPTAATSQKVQSVRSTSPKFEFDSDSDERASLQNGNVIGGGASTQGRHPTRLPTQICSTQLSLPPGMNPSFQPTSSTWSNTPQFSTPSPQFPVPASTPANMETQNAWLLLQQQQQLLYQLQQQQAVTVAALAGIAAKQSPQALDDPGKGLTATRSYQCQADVTSSEVSGATFFSSDGGLSGPASASTTPTMATFSDPRSVVRGHSRQEALIHQLRGTNITLPPPPPPPASDKPFGNTRKKSKAQSLEALMNSLHYTDLLTPSYSSKEQTQSETGVIVDEDTVTPSGPSPAILGSQPALSPSVQFTPGYKRKPCRAFFSSAGCKHGEKCLFCHESDPTAGSTKSSPI